MSRCGLEWPDSWELGSSGNWALNNFNPSHDEIRAIENLHRLYVRIHDWLSKMSECLIPQSRLSWELDPSWGSVSFTFLTETVLLLQVLTEFPGVSRAGPWQDLTSPCLASLYCHLCSLIGKVGLVGLWGSGDADIWRALGTWPSGDSVFQQLLHFSGNSGTGGLLGFAFI